MVIPQILLKLCPCTSLILPLTSLSLVLRVSQHQGCTICWVFGEHVLNLVPSGNHAMYVTYCLDQLWLPKQTTTVQVAQMTNTYILTVLEARSPDQGANRVGCSETSLLGKQVASTCCLLACHSFACTFPVSLCVLISFSYTDSSQTGLGPTPKASF